MSHIIKNEVIYSKYRVCITDLFYIGQDINNKCFFLYSVMTRCVFVIGLVENKRAILKRKHCSTLKCTTSVSIKNNGLYCTMGLITSPC